MQQQEKNRNTRPNNTNARTSPKSPRPRKPKAKFITDAPAQKKIIWCCAIGIIIAIVIIIANQCLYPISDDTQHTSLCGCATAPIKSKNQFRDINPDQLAHAHANGIKHPIDNLEELNSRIDELIKTDQLVRIKANEYYNIRPLTHSVPYLTPEAKQLLDIIGRRFQYNLHKVGLPKYKFQLSSLLRTVEYQQQLTRINTNATPNESAHYYGTTFDIAYHQYDRRGRTINDPKVEAILEQTLLQLRRECRLMIIRERSNKCFHITVVKKK